MNSEVVKLQAQFGSNVLPRKEKTTGFNIFINQFKNSLIYILVAAAMISLYFHEYFDVYLIIGVVMLDVVMGFYQEYKAHKTLIALRNILKLSALVIREGVKKEIDVADLVPGDLVVIGSGDKIPADGKLIEGTNVLVNESILTGESEAAAKRASGKNTILYMGTIVISGAGVMRVEKIGSKTEIGKIGKSLETIEDEETPLQKKLETFSKNLSYLIISICLVIFIVGVFFQQRDLWETFRISIVLAVAAIPVGLPIAVTIVMALGMHKILEKQGLVKKLISIETLGTTSIICTDKTGTLTEGKMTVVKTKFADKKNGLLALALDNDQRTNLEVAILAYAKEQGIKISEIHELHPRVFQEPFSSEAKYSFSINQFGKNYVSFMLGGPEVIIDFCAAGAGEKERIKNQTASWAKQGLRILGIAFKKSAPPDGVKKLLDKKNYTWAGLIGIIDPIRKEVKNALIEARKAGISTKIVTGDYEGTAINVAREIGLRVDKNNIISGEHLEKLSTVDLKQKIANIDVFYRILPEQKLKIIKVLQDNGEIVAMTGDGVNDVPALKKAEIGVVVGKNASEVARETGDLVLLDGNFKTIISAVEEGRLVFANIKKLVAYILSNSFAEIVLIFGAMMLDLPAPLTVVQILWLYLICDGPPDIFLSYEPKESHIMQENPKKLQAEEILDTMPKILILAISLFTGISALILFNYYQADNLTLARTIAFAASGIVSLIYIFSFKSFHKPLYKIENFFANKFLIIGSLYGFLLLFLAIYLPFFNKFLGTAPLNFVQWIIIFSIGIILTVIVEIIKLINNHYYRASSTKSKKIAA